MADDVLADVGRSVARVLSVGAVSCDGSCGMPDLPRGVIPLSAKTGYGMDRLLDALRDACRGAEPAENGMTQQRHLLAAKRCVGALKRAVDAIDMGFPLDTVSSDIREGLDALGEITGENLSETVIDEIFKNFCVGK